ncbi:MAG: hypothetical protein ACP5N1_06975 [Candidatus Woesearchaeota archaeon]
MGESIKKAFYVGAAAVSGAVGYFLGKYKSRKLVSTTALGLILIMCAPRGFDIAEKYLILNTGLKKEEIRREAKKDSLNTVLELQYPTNRLTTYLDKTVSEIYTANNAVKSEYESMISNNAAKYQQSLDSIANQNKLIVENINSKLLEQNSEFDKRFKEIDAVTNTKNNFSYKTTKASTNDASSNIEKVVRTEDNDAKRIFDHYIIDVDKSSRKIALYGAYINGDKNFLNVSSNASFPTNGGPDNGEYVAKNKGDRSGELFPGFIAIDDPVGITGAGEYDQYIDDIKRGALTNKTGIRVPNDVYNRLLTYVTNKETIVHIHD